MIEHLAQKARIFLADDHPVMRQGIARIIQEEPDMEVVGQADNGAAAIEAILRLRPDVVLMDIGLPDISGIDAARQIIEAIPETRVIMLTVYDRDDLFLQALEAGAAGYVLKGAQIDDLLRAIRTVQGGEMAVSPRMTTKLVQDYLQRLRRGEGQDAYGKLSAREREVLPLLAEHRTSQEIAEMLNISPYTVQTYRQRIMQKLSLHSRGELLKYALRRGFIGLER